MSADVQTHIYIDRYMYVPTSVYVERERDACTYACMHGWICMQSCMHVFTKIKPCHVQVHMDKHRYKHVCTNVCICIERDIDVFMYVCKPHHSISSSTISIGKKICVKKTNNCKHKLAPYCNKH